MKIIFLDVDGVINTFEKKEELKVLNNNKDDWDYNNIFCKISLANLREIVDVTGAKIVLESTRRFSQSLLIPMKYQFMEYGLSYIGVTPNVDGNKLNEILKYIDNSDKNIENYIILDDDSKYFENELSFIKVNPRYGITNDVVEIAIKKLK